MQGAVVLVLCALLYYGSVGAPASARCYPAIFVFGDSYSDTGNGYLSGGLFFRRTAQRPYGETFPGYPFTRFSDGRLLLDFLARYLGLPLLNPYLNTSASFSRGVNYAVSGSTAEDATYLNSKRIFPQTNLSLNVQLGWHLALKSSNATSNKPDANAYNNGLYVLEFGINDYIQALQSGYKPSYVNNTFLPLVIDKIRNATQVLFNNGARNFLFISIPPLGCFPSELSLFLLDTKDSNNWLENINSLSYNHGVKLLSLVQDLRAAHPKANFTFADFYGAYTQVIQNSAIYGFSNTLDACCGAGPLFPYRYNLQLFCSSLSNTMQSTLCSNPNNFLSWDGIHLTEKVYSYIFNLTVASGSYLNPSKAFPACTNSTF